MKIIKGDRVVVLAGKDKGAEGVVQKAMPETGKVVVEGVNMITKHVKPMKEGEQGRLVKRENPIHISNVKPSDAPAPAAEEA